VISDLVRSTLAGTALLSGLAASCGIDIKGLPDIRVELREPLEPTCVRGSIESLGKTEAELDFDTTTKVVRVPGSGYEMTADYAMHLGTGSTMLLIVPPGSNRERLAATVPYFCPLLGHETGHLLIGRAVAAHVHGVETAHGSDLAQTRSALQARVDAQYRDGLERARRDEEAYDALTEHGIAQRRAASMRAGISTADIPPCHP
jgi:hypothetical protein